MGEKEQIEQMKAAFSKYAESQGFRLNPDNAEVERICKSLLANQRKHGARYCPCRVVTGNKDEDRKNICPCIYHRDEVKKKGRCHCRLFVK
ncbi:MAG: ferredoxin:thioredoxin reductase [Candidatus Aenigmatarchaeota archaeon]|nr:MAG: ferredoxin:thioredoxin reductase [Candidatus Aenigmarchaeota archaeon]